jgi:RNA polymerase sigma-32 factor
MNRRLGGDASLNTPIRDDGNSGEWQDWLVDDTSSQERVLVENEDFDNRRKALGEALTVLNDRKLRILEASGLIDQPIALDDLAEKFGVSREGVRQIEVRAFEKVQKVVRRSPSWNGLKCWRRTEDGFVDQFRDLNRPGF